MKRKSIDMHCLQDLVRLHRQGTGKRKTARLLSLAPNTERKYREALEQAGLLDGDPDDLPPLETLKQTVDTYCPASSAVSQLSSLEGWRSVIEEKFEKGAGPTSIYDYLRLEDTDFPGSLSAVKRMCLALKRERGVQPEDVAIPLVSDPGESAQVDFGYAGRRASIMSARNPMKTGKPFRRCTMMEAFLVATSIVRRSNGSSRTFKPDG